MMTNKQPQRVKTISEYHRLKGLPKPEHPLISLVNYEDIKNSSENNSVSWIFDFYSIALKRNLNVKMKYGQQSYDFDEGVMFFIAPNQVFSIEVQPESLVKPSGYILLIHPDFLWNTGLAKTIKHYEYFDYSVNEALFLSDKEETTIEGILQNIKHEYHLNIDKFTQDIIITQLELLLNYSDRFYNRQFLTRKIANHQILNLLEELLDEYFNCNKGIPTVQYTAQTLNLSSNYLSGVLKTLTGQSTQQHIHNKLIQKAKEKLSTTNLSISEIAYELGFEHLQSFSKLFKSKTSLSPVEFRNSFN
jgi:AraC family transcriptional regulator, transcriptional activator of pobA